MEAFRRWSGAKPIDGGAGGVGHFADQTAKALGGTKTATGYPSDVAFVESLGADGLIDYSREDFTR